jgi:predicted permease
MLHELRHAFRALMRSPAFTVPAVLCLALAIGANTAIFTVVDAVLLRPLPFPEPERLVGVWERARRRPEGFNVVAPANFLDWQRQSRAVATMGAIWERRLAVTGLGEAVEVPAQSVSASLFPTLGVSPVLGRTFTREEDAPNGPAAVVLSHGFWRSRLGGDRNAVGRTIVVDGEPRRVVGVMPAGFGVPGGAAAELWLPIAFDPATDYRVEGGRYLRVVGRLAPGATIESAAAELRAIARRLADAHPVYNAQWSAVVVGLHTHLVRGARRPLLVLAGVVAFVLLIACANVANLALARAAERRREVAVRAALGASRWQVVRGQLAESLLVSCMGGGLGLLVALWGTQALVAAAPSNLPRAAEVGIDGRTLAFTAILSLLTGVVFGLVPALEATRADLQSTLREGGRGASRGRARGALVVAQVALSLVLLVGAGLMIRSFARLNRVDPGFDAGHVFTAKIGLPGSRYGEPAQEAAFARALMERVRAVPGVQAASLTMYLPFDCPCSRDSYWIAGRPVPRPEDQTGMSVLAVDPDYFRTLGIPVLRGRPFTDADGPSSPRVVVISQSLAQAAFPNEDPIGRHLQMNWGDTLDAEIVAVVGDVRAYGLDSMPDQTTYWPLAQFQVGGFALVARAAGDPMALARPIADQLHALDADLPLADPRPLDSYLGASVATRRFIMLLLGSFAAVAVALAAIGIGGVIGNTVARRTREIGVRLALGAQPADVLRMVLRQGMALTAAGIGAGLVGAFALTRVLRSLLYGTSPTDALTYGAVALLLGVVAFVAAWLPARGATRVDPIVALQSE